MKLYYYTSTDTMRYILGSGDIYATNIRYTIYFLSLQRSV